MAADNSKYRQFARKPPTVPADDASLSRTDTHREHGNKRTAFSCTSLYRKLGNLGATLDTTVWDANAPSMVKESRDKMRRKQVSEGTSASLTQSVPVQTRALNLMGSAFNACHPSAEAALDAVVKGSMRKYADSSDDEPPSSRGSFRDDTLASLMSPKSTRGLRALYSHEVPSFSGTTGIDGSPFSLSRYLSDRDSCRRQSGNFGGQASLHPSSSRSPTSSLKSCDSPDFVGRRADFANTRKFEMALRTSQNQKRTTDKHVAGTLGRLMQTVTSNSSYMRGMRRRERLASDLGFGRALDLHDSDTRRPASPEMHEPPPLYVEEDAGPGEVAAASTRVRRLSPPKPFQDRGGDGGSARHPQPSSGMAKPGKTRQHRDNPASHAPAVADQAQLNQARLRAAEATAHCTGQAQDMARAARERGAAEREAVGTLGPSSLRESGADSSKHADKGRSGDTDRSESQLSSNKSVVVQIKNVDVSSPETLEYLADVSSQLKQRGLPFTFTKSVRTASLVSPVIVLTEDDVEARMVTVHDGSNSIVCRPLVFVLDDLHSRCSHVAKPSGAAASGSAAKVSGAQEASIQMEVCTAQEQVEDPFTTAEPRADDEKEEKGKSRPAKAKADHGPARRVFQDAMVAVCCARRS